MARSRSEKARTGCAGRISSWTLLVALAPAAAALAQHPPRLVFVVTTGADHPPAGPGVTLRQALEAAAADPRDNVVRFDPRVFAESTVRIVLERGLALRAGPEGAGHDTLEAAGCRIEIAGRMDTGPLLTAHGLTLAFRNVSFDASSTRGLYLSDCPEVRFERCTLSGSLGAGITAFGSGAVQVIESTITGCRTHAIETHDQVALLAAESSLSGNGQSGLAQFDRSRAILADCRLDDNGRWAAVVSASASLRADRTEMRRSGLAHLDAGADSHVELNDCSLRESKRFGIMAGGRSQVRLIRCAVTSQAARGIELQDEAQAVLRQTLVGWNGHFGIVLFGRSIAHIDGGSISGNRGHGMAVRDQATAEAYDCRFERNEYSGIGAPDAGSHARALARRCTFHGNGMRPIFRGPMHIDPPVPTVARIDGRFVLVRTPPRATVDLYLDTGGEAARYLRTVVADDIGTFRLSLDEVPSGQVMTAAATTVDGHTSEFNVIAAQPDREILAALLARTGPLSDAGGPIDTDAAVQRWRPGTHVVFQFAERPPPHVVRYVQWFTQRLGDWTTGTVTADAAFEPPTSLPPGAMSVPIEFAYQTDERLRGAGGTTYTRWDSQGFFTGPIRIVLARAGPAELPCPRVAVHEMLHAMGLYHARVGLLSRMQGMTPPATGYVNDFAPAPTFHDVLALQVLYKQKVMSRITIAQLTRAGLLPQAPGPSLAAVRPSERPTTEEPESAELNHQTASRQ